MDKIARIDMGAAGGPKVTVEPLGNYAGLGGRAMTSVVVSKEVHPLAPRWERKTSWSSPPAC